MKVLHSELKRRQVMHEYMTTTHMFCLFIMMWALGLSNKMFSLVSYDTTMFRLLIFLGVALLGFSLITAYNTKYAEQIVDSKFTWVDLVYITVPLFIAGFTIFIMGEKADNWKTVLLLPVIISASLLGQRAGIIMAAISTAVIYLHSILMGPSSNLFIILESNMVLISVMFIIGWFTGGQTNLESQSRRQLIKLANTDPLTGLCNFGFFSEQISKYMEEATDDQPLSLIFLDIDYFKHFNDIHGHQAGDILLIEVADILSTKVNVPGFATRYGGDEFMLMLPGSDSAAAFQLAEDISQTIKDRKFQGEEYQPDGKLTISCGIASFPQHALNAKELIKHADEALYRAKSLEKNKIEMYYSVFDNLNVKEDEKDLINSIRTLVSVINAKDRYTYGHSERVTNLSHKVASRLGLNQEQTYHLNYAAFLHDIGKIEIDREVLNKVEPLTAAEWEALKMHSRWGSDIVNSVNKLRPIVPIILHHHENYDGSGYPVGLQGEAIPIQARIIRVVDSYDSMISHRPYRQNLSVDAAMEELRSNAGTQFDPNVVYHLLAILKEEMQVRGNE